MECEMEKSKFDYPQISQTKERTWTEYKYIKSYMHKNMGQGADMDILRNIIHKQRQTQKREKK